MGRTLNSKHILLALLYAPGPKGDMNEPISGRTRIMKMIFLFKKEIQKKFLKDTNIKDINLPDFYPWNYGPYSYQVLEDLEFFVNNGFVECEASDIPSEPESDELMDWAKRFLFLDELKAWKQYSPVEEVFTLTERGLVFVRNKLWAEFTSNQYGILAEFKRVSCSASLNAILRYIYTTYPETAEKSKVRDKIIGRSY